MLEYFRLDNLSAFTGAFVVFFSALILLYSAGFMRSVRGLFRYYLYIILTLVASLGVVFANNLLVLVVFWGFLGLLLYLLINFGDRPNTSATAKKAFIIIGGTDALMLLGLAFIWHITGTVDIDKLSIPLTTKMANWAYLCLAAGAFAKAGAMPFHTWVPDTAEDAPTPVTAYLPASLDKLLGIYFLVRISLDIFKMSPAMNTVLMAFGSLTIVAAVMMALIQHDLRRLLGYHAVSQVGYMVLGIGTGNPVGIAGGLFHMLNHAIYKSCLFLSGGVVEKRTGTTDLEKLGGLAKILPVSFITFFIASFAISGVPPLNGFYSKWMVYQGIIEQGKTGGGLWILWLIAAMFGSALTLASFMKLLHTVYLGQRSKESHLTPRTSRLGGFAMRLPIIILAALCVVFGVLAYRLPLKYFIFPSLGGIVNFSSGLWFPGRATILMLVAIAVGLVIYLAGAFAKARVAPRFVGGELLEEHPDMRVSGVEFYDTIKEIGILKPFYWMAEKKLFDVYVVGGKLVSGFTAILRYIHNGVLSTYLAWCLLGMGILFWILLR